MTNVTSVIMECEGIC